MSIQDISTHTLNLPKSIILLKVTFFPTVQSLRIVVSSSMVLKDKFLKLSFHHGLIKYKRINRKISKKAKGYTKYKLNFKIILRYN